VFFTDLFWHCSEMGPPWEKMMKMKPENQFKNMLYLKTKVLEV